MSLLHGQTWKPSQLVRLSAILSTSDEMMQNDLRLNTDESYLLSQALEGTTSFLKSTTLFISLLKCQTSLTSLQGRDAGVCGAGQCWNC